MYLLASGLKNQNMIPHKQLVTVTVNTNKREAERSLGISQSDMSGYFAGGCTFWGLIVLGFQLS